MRALPQFSYLEAALQRPPAQPKAIPKQPGKLRLLTVHQISELLNVSESWVRRHERELPLVRMGRLVRFDSSLLSRSIRVKSAEHSGSRLKSGKETRMGLRRYQRGFVYRTKHGWYGMFRQDVRKADGSMVRKQRNVKLGTLAELPTKSAAIERLSGRMSCPDGPKTEMKFRELVEKWRLAAVPTIKETTACYYLKTLRVHVVPAFGERQISEITKYDVELFLAEKAPKYCRNTLRGMRVSLGRVLAWAVSSKWLKENPCAGVKLPCAGSRIVRSVLRPKDVLAIAAGLREPYRTLVLFLAVTGLRIGEAIAIRWSDLNGDVLRVERRIYEGRVSDPKTRSSVRELPLPAAILERLSGLRQSRCDGWVFQSRDGTPVNPGNALKRYIRPVVKALGLSIGGWHDFRHTLATRLLTTGTPLKIASGILGHSDARATLGYQHPCPEDFRAALEEVASQMLCDVTTKVQAGGVFN